MTDNEWKTLWASVEKFAHLESIKHAEHMRKQFIEKAQENILKQLKDKNVSEDKQRSYAMASIYFTHDSISRAYRRKRHVVYKEVDHKNPYKKWGKEHEANDIQSIINALTKLQQHVATQLMSGFNIKQVQGMYETAEEKEEVRVAVGAIRSALKDYVF